MKSKDKDSAVIWYEEERGGNGMSNPVFHWFSDCSKGKKKKKGKNEFSLFPPRLK